MKLLPKEPTPTMMAAYAKCGMHLHRDGYNAMYAAAPEVKDEPFTWAVVDEDGDIQINFPTREEAHEFITCGIAENTDDDHVVSILANCVVRPLYSSPRIAEMEQEVARLREQLGLVALVAHSGGLVNLDPSEALVAIRRLTTQHFNKSLSIEDTKRELETIRALKEKA